MKSFDKNFSVETFIEKKAIIRKKQGLQILQT